MPLGHHGAVDGVALDQRELGVGEAPGLVEDRARRVQLADVVQRGGGADLGHLCGRQAHRGGDPLSVPRDALGVAVGAGVPRLQQLAEADQRLETGALGVVAEQLLGLREPPLRHRAPQPAPQHEVGEHQVLRRVQALPDRLADAGREQRQHDPHEEREDEHDHAARRDEQGDEHRREHHDEARRNDGMGQPPLVAGSAAGAGNADRHSSHIGKYGAELNCWALHGRIADHVSNLCLGRSRVAAQRDPRRS